MPYSPLPPPPEPQGPTLSTPVNVGAGAVVLGGTNALTGSQLGSDVVGIAAGITMLFQGIKSFEWFEQHRWAPFVLLALGFTMAYIVTQGDIAQTIVKGGGAAFQAMANYVSTQAAGLGGLAPSTVYPGSKE